MILTDAHCHLANLAQMMPLAPLLSEAAQQGISAFASSALSRKEINYHLQQVHSGVIFSAGIHPNFDECDLELDDVETLAGQHKIWAIGEIGLDRNNPDIEWQRQIFRQQLEIAARHGLPVVLHLVGHQQEACNLLSEYKLSYLVHGYAGSVEAYHSLAGLGAFFTISSRILKPDKHALLLAIVADKRFLFETDITQYYVHENEHNPLLRLLDVLQQTAAVSGISQDELLQIQADNALRLGMIKP